ncbi:Ca(2+)/H(+) antiporter [Symbiodinium microadriaticum]|uniref:Ca(2+)/H(+) antiporter n=1 Tax=Symbiodinium microadriaticum TaxID=2951 RepID=A0A1Q9EL49_SYMMI|nr:Ca(2+)/H(+) antiporter [Symbiodinium microadriaticum]
MPTNGFLPHEWNSLNDPIPFFDYWRIYTPFRKDIDSEYFPNVNTMRWPYGTKEKLAMELAFVPPGSVSGPPPLRRTPATGLLERSARSLGSRFAGLCPVAAALAVVVKQRDRSAVFRHSKQNQVFEVRAGRIRRKPSQENLDDNREEWFNFDKATVQPIAANSAIRRLEASEDLSGLKEIILGSPLNLMLIFAPLGLASETLGWGEVATFLLSFLAIVPLAKLLGEATEQLALSVGQTLGGLLNATFGNAVEMIIAIFALREGLTEVVKGSLVGSIVSNLLLVLGMCFFCGGLQYNTQRFSPTGARAQYSLLLLAVLALVIPTVVLLTGARPDSELLISRGCAIVLAVLYVCYLVFQLYTHKDQFGTEANEEEPAEEEQPMLSKGASLALLLVATVIVAPLSEGLTGSVEGVTKTLQLSDAFVGVILLPIVGNAAEHLTAVTVATKDKMDLSLGVALGSSTQIALFVVPFTVIAGWFMDVPMDLNFKSLDVSILLLTVLIVGSTISDGESNWLEGAALIGAYLLIAVSLWYICLRLMQMDYVHQFGKGVRPKAVEEAGILHLTRGGPSIWKHSGLRHLWHGGKDTQVREEAERGHYRRGSGGLPSLFPAAILRHSRGQVLKKKIAGVPEEDCMVSPDVGGGAGVLNGLQLVQDGGKEEPTKQAEDPDLKAVTFCQRPSEPSWLLATHMLTRCGRQMLRSQKLQKWWQAPARHDSHSVRPGIQAYLPKARRPKKPEEAQSHLHATSGGVSRAMAEKKSRWGRKEKKVEQAPPVLQVRHRDLELPGAVAVLLENYFTVEECERYFKVLTNDIDWRHQQITVTSQESGDRVTGDEPRRTLFMSDPGICYEYSGRENVGQQWHPAVLEIKKKAEEGLAECGLPQVVFNSAQMNRYDFPRHTLGMHADNEPDLDRDSPIVSVSFGATRDFVIQDKGDEKLKWVISLADGSWFVMGGAMQQRYLHGVPHGGMPGIRINLTFRVCIPRTPAPC